MAQKSQNTFESYGYDLNVPGALFMQPLVKIIKKNNNTQLCDDNIIIEECIVNLIISLLYYIIYHIIIQRILEYSYDDVVSHLRLFYKVTVV